MTVNQTNPRQLTRAAQPLIHCITNPISIHDCANIILAAGGRPIMAEHPAEVAEITRSSHALALNLGNITDAVSYTHLDVYKRQGFPRIFF